MAAGDLVYGTRTALADIATRLSASMATGTAYAFGEIDNSTVAALDYHIHIDVPISTSATTGTYSLYFVESQEGSEWTDNIDPSAATNYSSYIKDAKLIKAAETIWVATARATVEFHFNLTQVCSFPPKYFGFVLKNNSGQTLPSAADGDSMSIKIATS